MICACFAVKRGQKLSKSLRRVFCDTATTMLLYKRGKRSCCSNKKSSLDCPRTKPQLDLEKNTQKLTKNRRLFITQVFVYFGTPWLNGFVSKFHPCGTGLES